ncbi:hypothetical protein A3Q56_03392 [Intoshia linei]|uniref:Uncharacterized protein n=1 Tax=Intoshia linei TaxID=1819745 RepID=A0A177B5F8_9BILA|nr:hypothetical protein A3Q56_03392 [Intoshia linei]
MNQFIMSNGVNFRVCLYVCPPQTITFDITKTVEDLIIYLQSYLNLNESEQFALYLIPTIDIIDIIENTIILDRKMKLCGLFQILKIDYNVVIRLELRLEYIDLNIHQLMTNNYQLFSYFYQQCSCDFMVNRYNICNLFNKEIKVRLLTLMIMSSIFKTKLNAFTSESKLEMQNYNKFATISKYKKKNRNTLTCENAKLFNSWRDVQFTKYDTCKANFVKIPKNDFSFGRIGNILAVGSSLKIQITLQQVLSSYKTFNLPEYLFCEFGNSSKLMDNVKKCAKSLFSSNILFGYKRKSKYTANIKEFMNCHNNLHMRFITMFCSRRGFGEYTYSINCPTMHSDTNLIIDVRYGISLTTDLNQRKAMPLCTFSNLKRIKLKHGKEKTNKNIHLQLKCTHPNKYIINFSSNLLDALSCVEVVRGYCNLLNKSLYNEFIKNSCPGSLEFTDKIRYKISHLLINNTDKDSDKTMKTTCSTFESNSSPLSSSKSLFDLNCSFKEKETINQVGKETRNKYKDYLYKKYKTEKESGFGSDSGTSCQLIHKEDSSLKSENLTIMKKLSKLSVQDFIDVLRVPTPNLEIEKFNNKPNDIQETNGFFTDFKCESESESYISTSTLIYNNLKTDSPESINTMYECKNVPNIQNNHRDTNKCMVTTFSNLENGENKKKYGNVNTPRLMKDTSVANKSKKPMRFEISKLESCYSSVNESAEINTSEDASNLSKIDITTALSDSSQSLSNLTQVSYEENTSEVCNLEINYNHSKMKIEKNYYACKNLDTEYATISDMKVNEINECEYDYLENFSKFAEQNKLDELCVDSEHLKDKMEIYADVRPNRQKLYNRVASFSRASDNQSETNLTNDSPCIKPTKLKYQESFTRKFDTLNKKLLSKHVFKINEPKPTLRKPPHYDKSIYKDNLSILNKDSDCLDEHFVENNFVHGKEEDSFSGSMNGSRYNQSFIKKFVNPIKNIINGKKRNSLKFSHSPKSLLDIYKTLDDKTLATSIKKINFPKPSLSNFKQTIKSAAYMVDSIRKRPSIYHSVVPKPGPHPDSMSDDSFNEENLINLDDYDPSIQLHFLLEEIAKCYTEIINKTYSHLNTPIQDLEITKSKFQDLIVYADSNFNCKKNACNINLSNLSWFHNREEYGNKEKIFIWNQSRLLVSESKEMIKSCTRSFQEYICKVSSTLHSLMHVIRSFCRLIKFFHGRYLNDLVGPLYDIIKIMHSTIQTCTHVNKKYRTDCFQNDNLMKQATQFANVLCFFLKKLPPKYSEWFFIFS